MEENQKNCYLILVVIYNVDLKASETITSLLNSRHYLNNSSVIVWDNSLHFQQQSTVDWVAAGINDVRYIHRAENITLSKIYNEVINKHRDDKYSHLILLDQDSTFGPEYFFQLNKSINRFRDISLFLPIVISSNQIVSPANIFLFKGEYWGDKKIGLVKAKHKTAINSGMVISFEYLRDKFPGYDERFKFYGTDTFFMKLYSKYNDEFCVFDCVVKHHLAYKDGTNVEGIIKRHPENVRAIFLLNSENIAIRLLTLVYVLIFSIKQSIKHKDIRFLKW